MVLGGSEQDLRDKREVRGQVTRALASLPVSSLQDAAQISSALAQSTVSLHPLLMKTQSVCSLQMSEDGVKPEIKQICNSCKSVF